MKDFKSLGEKFESECPSAVFLISLIKRTSLKHQRLTTNGQIHSIVPANEVPSAHSTKQPFVCQPLTCPLYYPLSSFGSCFKALLLLSPLLFDYFCPRNQMLIPRRREETETRPSGVHPIGRPCHPPHPHPTLKHCCSQLHQENRFPSQRLWSSPNHQSTELLGRPALWGSLASVTDPRGEGRNTATWSSPTLPALQPSTSRDGRCTG